MAVTPVENEAFLREVDDELRREQMTTAWRRYGRIGIAVVLIALAALAGWLWWQSHREAQAGERAETLAKAIGDLGDNKLAAAKPALATLAASGDASYATAARLTAAGVALVEGDRKAAAAGYRAVAGDTRAAQPFRDLATLRLVATEFDTLPPEQVIERLKPLAVPGGAWFGSAGEMTAAAWLKLGQPAKAGPLFAAIARDRSVPETLRARAVRISGQLGIDTVGMLQDSAGTAADARGTGE